MLQEFGQSPAEAVHALKTRFNDVNRLKRHLNQKLKEGKRRRRSLEGVFEVEGARLKSVIAFTTPSPHSQVTPCTPELLHGGSATELQTPVRCSTFTELLNSPLSHLPPPFYDETATTPLSSPAVSCASSCVTPAGSGATPTGSGATPTGSAVTPTGSVTTPTGSGLTPTGSGLTPTGSTNTPLVTYDTPTDRFYGDLFESVYFGATQAVERYISCVNVDLPPGTARVSTREDACW